MLTEIMGEMDWLERTIVGFAAAGLLLLLVRIAFVVADGW